MITRLMTSADVSRIYEIEQESFSTPWSLESFKKELENSQAHYLVAVIENQVVGYGGFWKIIDEAHVTNIAIEEKFRGNGYGKCLIEAMVKLAVSLHIDKMTLEVRQSNVVAQHAYRANGFVAVGSRPRYYKKPEEDATIMWLSMIKEDLQ